MTPLLSVLDLHQAFGNRVVLDGVSFTVNAGDRVGLVGLNGAGKSTLLRLVAAGGADAGTVRRRRGLELVYVPQEPALPAGATVDQVLREGQAAHGATLDRLAALEARIPTLDGPALDQALEDQALLHERLQRLGGWDVSHERDAFRDALELPGPEAPVDALSGGERRRVAIARALLAHPDVLLLDEPTNHLDAFAIQWLEGWLRARVEALLLVTHDRYFLDRVATRILELDRGALHAYEGNYTRFLEKQAERLAVESAQEDRRAAFVRRELEWIRRKPGAQRKQDHARVDRFEAAVAAKPEPGKAAPGERSLRLRLPPGPRLGKTVVELHGAGRKLGDRWLFDKLDFALKPGERIGILGPNGAGKTTLVRVLTGELPPDRGRVVIGPNTRFAVVDQTRAALDDANTVIQEVAGGADRVDLGEGDAVHVRTFLRMFLFDDAQADLPVSRLSGGERNRVALAKLLRRGGNVLVLDEPTNDLDLVTLSVLEEALVDFPGCVLVVSHDRWFLDKVATSILAFEGGGRVVRYEGGATEALKRMEQLGVRLGGSAAERAAAERAAAERVAARPAAEGAPPARAPEPAKRRLTWKEKQELAGMEATIEAAEARVAALDARLADPATYRGGVDVRALATELDAARAEVDRLYARWEALGALEG